MTNYSESDNTIKVTIGVCARCGANHVNLEFRKMHTPIDDSDGTSWTHFALCPFTDEPILLLVNVSHEDK